MGGVSQPPAEQTATQESPVARDPRPERTRSETVCAHVFAWRRPQSAQDRAAKSFCNLIAEALSGSLADPSAIRIVSSDSCGRRNGRGVAPHQASSISLASGSSWGRDDPRKIPPLVVATEHHDAALVREVKRDHRPADRHA
jgi:hypothetical protein